MSTLVNIWLFPVICCFDPLLKWSTPVLVRLIVPHIYFNPNRLEIPQVHVPISHLPKGFGVNRSTNDLVGTTKLRTPQKNTIPPAKPYEFRNKRVVVLGIYCEALRWVIAVLRPVRESHTPIEQIPSVKGTWDPLEIFLSWGLDESIRFFLAFRSHWDHNRAKGLIMVDVNSTLYTVCVSCVFFRK